MIIAAIARRIFFITRSCHILSMISGRREQSAIAARQQTRLEDLVRYTKTHSPFYRKVYRDKGYLQPITKHDLMAHFDDWVTDPEVSISSVEDFLREERHVGSLYMNRYAVFTTSGVTGKHGIFVHDIGALRVYTAPGIARNSLGLISPGYIFSLLSGGGRVAVVVATGGHFAGVAATEFARRFDSELSKRVRAFSVLMPLSVIVKELDEFQPAILFGYPTVLLLLAYEQRAREIGSPPCRSGYRRRVACSISPQGDRAGISMPGARCLCCLRVSRDRF